MRAILLLLVLLAACHTGAYEANPALERQPFSTVVLAPEGVDIGDPAGDVVIFDPQGRHVPPSFIADLTAFHLRKVDDQWQAHFEIAVPLPEDPPGPVNFFVYLDVDGDQSNNAPTGVGRAGSDAIVMLIFGGRTSWHSQWWRYTGGNWEKQASDPPFHVSTGDYTLTLPPALGLQPNKTTVRAFSLTSDNEGITAQDVAPGEGYPPLRSATQ